MFIKGPSSGLGAFCGTGMVVVVVGRGGKKGTTVQYNVQAFGFIMYSIIKRASKRLKAKLRS